MVEVDFARRHARIDFVDDDDLLGFYLASARQAAENYLGRILVPQTLRYTFSEATPNASMPLLPVPLLVIPILLSTPQLMNKPIELPRANATAIEAVTTLDRNGVSTVLTEGTDYTVDLSLDPARIRLHWLTTPTRLLHVQIDFAAGYQNVQSVPNMVVHAILLLTAHFYENRGDTDAAPPQQFYDLLTPYRVSFFGA